MAMSMYELAKDGGAATIKIDPSVEARLNQASDGQEVAFHVEYNMDERNAFFIKDDPDRLTVGQATTMLAKIRERIKNGANLSPQDRAVLVRSETVYAQKVWQGLVAMRQADMDRLAVALQKFKTGWVYSVATRSKLIPTAGKFSVDKGEPVLNFVVRVSQLKDDSALLAAILARPETPYTETRKPSETVNASK